MVLKIHMVQVASPYGFLPNYGLPIFQLKFMSSISSLSKLAYRWLMRNPEPLGLTVGEIKTFLVVAWRTKSKRIPKSLGRPNTKCHCFTTH